MEGLNQDRKDNMPFGTIPLRYLSVSSENRAQSNMDNLTFILGGARSGKSALAEQRAREYGRSVIYCATAEILDEEMRDRVARHRSRRPSEWRTVEAPHDAAGKLAAALAEEEADCVLFDCLSILSSNVLLSLDEKVGEAEAFAALCEQELDALFALIAAHPQTRFILVSNEVGMGVVPAYKLGRTYRDLLGRANQAAAARAGEVIFMIAGIPLRIK
ncbi:MAG: bifunctional adenosylcobinamide kinase/adenosylcobinamide-phosphate guanylyltransferase [Anaerolineaceae bacterium]|nr:bifunctional adenosylcobinamide kinase/adenosylcobinamide-phosphate guanylyltransferase [Anaerolineaceae bacterium]